MPLAVATLSKEGEITGHHYNIHMVIQESQSCRHACRWAVYGSLFRGSVMSAARKLVSPLLRFPLLHSRFAVDPPHTAHSGCVFAGDAADYSAVNPACTVASHPTQLRRMALPMLSQGVALAAMSARGTLLSGHDSRQRVTGVDTRLQGPTGYHRGTAVSSLVDSHCSQTIGGNGGK